MQEGSATSPRPPASDSIATLRSTQESSFNQSPITLVSGSFKSLQQFASRSNALGVQMPVEGDKIGCRFAQLSSGVALKYDVDLKPIIAKHLNRWNMVIVA